MGDLLALHRGGRKPGILEDKEKTRDCCHHGY